MNSLRKACAQAAAAVPRHARRFGGDRRYRYPEVYSPAGGWWNTNPNAKRNTAVAAAVIFSLAVPVAVTSARLEVSVGGIGCIGGCVGRGVRGRGCLVVELEDDFEVPCCPKHAVRVRVSVDAVCTSRALPVNFL